MEYKGQYIVNINSKRIHDVLHSTKRCKLSIMQQDNAVFFDNLDDALNYPNKMTPRTSKCQFCFKE